MAKKNITQATYLTNNVQNLPDLVEDQASLVKQTFDKVGLDGKTYVNETLITELESVTLNDSGAHRIGLNVANVTADNAADGIAEVKADIQGVVVGTIPDNTLTEAKMAADMKKQSGGVYPFDSGTDLETDVAANLVKLDIARTAVTDTGIADAYVVDTAGTFDLTLDGNILTFIPSNTNTSTSQIVIDGQTAKAIKKADDTGTLIDIEEGDLLKNRPSQLAWSVGSDFFILRPSGVDKLKVFANTTLFKQTFLQSVTTFSRLNVNGSGWVVAIGNRSASSYSYKLKIDGSYVVGDATTGAVLQDGNVNYLLHRFDSSFDFENNEQTAFSLVYLLGDKLDKTTPIIYIGNTTTSATTLKLDITGKGWIYGLNAASGSDNFKLIVDGSTVQNDRNIGSASLPSMIRFESGFQFYDASNRIGVQYVLD